MSDLFSPWSKSTLPTNLTVPTDLEEEEEEEEALRPT